MPRRRRYQNIKSSNWYAAWKAIGGKIDVNKMTHTRIHYGADPVDHVMLCGCLVLADNRLIQYDIVFHMQVQR